MSRERIAGPRTDAGRDVAETERRPALRLRATVRDAGGRWLATCLELEACGEGKTRNEALASLRAAIEERETPEAVAPPPDARAPCLEIVVVEGDATERAHEPTGPGDGG